MLSHFDVVVWETGDDRLVQDPEDALTDTFLFGPVPEIAVAERQHFLTIALRDFLNEGGKLVQAGENTQYSGLLGRSLGGIFYGLDGAPDQDCVITERLPDGLPAPVGRLRRSTTSAPPTEPRS